MTTDATAGKMVAAPGQVPGVAIRVQPVVDIVALLGGLLDG